MSGIYNNAHFITSDDDDFALFIMCVCGEVNSCSQNICTDETRMFWKCPSCNVKFYFRPIDELRTEIIQVINE